MSNAAWFFLLMISSLSSYIIGWIRGYRKCYEDMGE